MPSRTLWISIRTNWIQRSTQKNAGGGERRTELRRSTRRQQFIIKVSSWRFYNRQEEVLNQKSPKVIDRFVFDYLAIDNHRPFIGDDTFQNQSVKLICWQAFSFIRFFNCFFLFSFQAEIFYAFQRWIPVAKSHHASLIGFCTLCWHFFEHFSEAKALSIIRAF